MAFLLSDDDELDTKAKVIGRLSRLMRELGTKATNFDVLILDSASQHFILGPALESSVSHVPNTYISQFPKCSDEDYLMNNQNANEWFHKRIRCWPTIDPNWVSWFQRMEDQKRYIWHQVGIYDILQFSKISIPFNRSLVLAALCFWSTSTNCFHLGLGPLTVTLMDLSALVGLRPDGLAFDALVTNSISIPDDNFGIEITKSSSFSSFIIEHNRIEGVVTDEEHVAFLLCWLCRYLLCSRSFKIVKANLPLAVALSRGESYAMGPLVLAHLYRGIKDLLDSQLGTSGGPIWILQLWLHAYFPKLRPECFPGLNLSCEGLKYALFNFKEPEISLQDCLLYMCHLEKEENFNFIPFSKSDALPPWFIFPQSGMSETEFSIISDIWASFLVSRDLPAGITIKRCRKKCGVEAYCPSLCARQFGLIQHIPTPPFFSFNTNFPDRTMLHSFEQFRELKVTTSLLFEKFKFVPFALIPSATTSFNGWWAKYYKEAFPHDQDLNYLFKRDVLDQSRPFPPLKSAGALKKRKGVAGKEEDPVPKIQCLSGRGRAYSMKRKTSTACHTLRSLIKGNYLSHAKSIEAIVAKKISSVSEEKVTTPTPKSHSQIGRGKSFVKKCRNKEVHGIFIDLTKSDSQSHSEAMEATFRRSKQQYGALDKGEVVDLTEDDIDFKPNLKDLPLTQAVDASNEELPIRASSRPTQHVAEPQLPQEPSIQSRPQPQSCHSNSSSKKIGSNHSGFRAKHDLKPLHSIRALDFLESYLLHHSEACSLGNAEAALVPDSDEVSAAKAKIQSISTLSLDEVMEMVCLQNFKSSLEILLKASDQTGLHFSNIENVREKLAFVESKYQMASGITAEVQKQFNQKIVLEQEVEVFTLRSSEAQNDEPKFLTCISVQNSVIEELEKKLVQEKAVLKTLEDIHAKHKTKMDELSHMLEHTQQLLHDHCMHEKTRVKKAMQAKKELKSVEATWIQIQQILTLISDQKLEGSTTP